MDNEKIKRGMEIWQRMPEEFNIMPLMRMGIVPRRGKVDYEKLTDWFDAQAEKEKEDAARPRESNCPDTSLHHHWLRRFIDMAMGILMQNMRGNKQQNHPNPNRQSR